MEEDRLELRVGWVHVEDRLRDGGSHLASSNSRPLIFGYPGKLWLEIKESDVLLLVGEIPGPFGDRELGGGRYKYTWTTIMKPMLHSELTNQRSSHTIPQP